MSAIYSNDAETGVLGGLLLLASAQGAEAVRDQLTQLRQLLPGEAFYGFGHRAVWRTMCELMDAGRPVEPVSIIQAMVDVGLADQGGEIAGFVAPTCASFIMQLATATVTLAYLADHAEIVRKKFIRRELLRICADTEKKVREETEEEQKLLDDTAASILRVSEANAPQDNFRGPKAGVMEAINQLQAAWDNRGGITGLPSGLMDFDRMTTGFKPGQMIVVCGSTGMGKTALMLQLAEHLAVDCGIPCGIFSLEMSYEELCQRALCSRAQVSLQRVRDGFLKEKDWDRLSKEASKLATAPLYIDDWSGLNDLELRARARHAVKKLGCRAIFLDYLQLVEGVSEGREDNRVMELARTSRGIKLTAKSLGVPFIVGAQLNRKPDERTSLVTINPFVIDEETRKPMQFKRRGVPQLGDLRECGAIGQDADLVVAPYRPWYWSNNGADLVSDHIEWAQLITLKQRNGPVGPVTVHFVSDETRFVTCPDKDGCERTNVYTNNKEKRQYVEGGNE